MKYLYLNVSLSILYLHIITVDLDSSESFPSCNFVFKYYSKIILIYVIGYINDLNEDKI